MKRQLKLITALGDKPELVLEFIDFFNGGDRYRYTQEAAAIRHGFAGQELVGLYLVCTAEAKVHDALRELRRVVKEEYPSLVDAIHFIELPCNDITCGDDDETMRQLVYDAVRELAADDLIISSGGRKPVTQRLIEAGLLYGCRGYFTITAERGKEKRDCSESFHVLWTSARRFSEERRTRNIRDELGDNFRSLYLLPLTLIERLQNKKTGIEPGKKAEELAWLRRLPKADLHCHLGGAFDVNLLKEMAAGLLDEFGVAAGKREMIRNELAAHAGKPISALTANDLLLLQPEKNGKPLVHPLQNIHLLLENIAAPKHVCIAVLVDSLTPMQLEAMSWQEASCLTSNESRLAWYMACGDLGGSALLQTRGNLRRALRWLMEEARKENVCFMEVRFSPDNYTRAGLTMPQVIEALLNEAHSFMGQNAGFQVNFLIMATRHKERAAMSAHVAAAVTFGQPGGDGQGSPNAAGAGDGGSGDGQGSPNAAGAGDGGSGDGQGSPNAAGARDGGSGPRITGFDLAGQEEGNDPALFQDIFLPLHHHFMNITIHAGEMCEDDKIWQAIYLLHARRIGHGLKLVNNKKMMGYVRDYGIAIEMCPSSNRQTNGFRFFDVNGDTGEIYPLKKYMDFGLQVTINTDNRGISRTTLSDEYLQAARLTQGGLSRWEILRLIKNSFKAAFLPKDEKDRLLKRIDEVVFSLILDDFFPEQRDADG